MKDSDGVPYSGIPSIMLVKNGASPPLGKPATSMFAPVCPPVDSGQMPGESFRMSAELIGLVSWMS